MSSEERSKTGVPESMRAIRQHEPGGRLVVESVPVPLPGPGEVLIKMHASPVNPSDLALLRGSYLERKYPFTPGLEGSGMVIRSGGGLMPALRTGKRVACSPDREGDGTWAEYMKTSAMKTTPLPSHLTYEQGAMMLVNPMTAMALLEMARKGRHRAMVNNAAASALGKMMIRLAAKYQLPLINIVRKEEDLKELQRMGARHVLNRNDRSFESELQKRTRELKATFIMDAVAGEDSSLLLRAAPRGSTLVVYARLSGDPMNVDPGSLIREEKQIIGFQLGNWLQTKGLLFKFRFINRVKKQLGDTLVTRISEQMPLEKAEEAISRYQQHMSAGKIILTME